MSLAMLIQDVQTPWASFCNDMFVGNWWSYHCYDLASGNMEFEMAGSEMTNHHTKIQNPLYEIPNDGGKIRNSAEMKNIHRETKLAVSGIQKALHFAKMKNLCTRFKLAGGRIQNAPH